MSEVLKGSFLSRDKEETRASAMLGLWLAADASDVTLGIVNNDNRSDSITSSHLTHNGTSADSKLGRCYKQSDNMNSMLADVRSTTEAVASASSLVLVHPNPMLQTAHCLARSAAP